MLRDQWITSAEGARILGVAQSGFPKYATAMAIRQRKIPGKKHHLWSRADLVTAIERLKAEEEERANRAREEWDLRTAKMREEITIRIEKAKADWAQRQQSLSSAQPLLPMPESPDD